MIKHIAREEAVLNVRLWTAERNWTLARCAEEMGVNPNTLKAWMRDSGLRYTIKAAVWMPDEDVSDVTDMSEDMSPVS